MNENYRKKAVNVKLIFAATAMATLALSAHSLKASAVPVDNFITPTAVQQQKTTVAGTVTDAAGEPIIGASIVVKGTTRGTVSDADGYFTLSAPQGATLEVSCIGFEKKTIKVPTSGKGAYR